MTVLSAKVKVLFNKMGGIASKYKLGDLLEDALGTVTADIADSAVTTAKIADANVTADKLATDSVTTSKIADGSITRAKIAAASEGVTVETFADPIMQSGLAGGATLGATGSVNFFRTMLNNIFQWHVKGTQTILGPSWAEGLGIDIAMDQTADDGIEVTQGIAATSPIGKTVDTDNFSFRAKVTVADVSGTDELVIGVRKAQAYATASATYTDQAAVIMNSTAVGIQTNLNNAGAALTDTTDTIADGESLDVKITVGDEARLQTAMTLANALKTTYNTHLADATEHTAGLQGAITAANATDYASLVTLITAMMASYVIHNADANLSSDWAYHIADGDNDALASAVPPTTLALCVTRLNDLKAKINLHVADGTSHTDGDSGLCAALDACNTMFQVGIDGDLAAPTVSKVFNFDAGDVVVPFLFMLNDTDCVDTAYLSAWEVTDITTSLT